MIVVIEVVIEVVFVVVVFVVEEKKEEVFVLVGLYFCDGRKKNKS